MRSNTMFEPQLLGAPFATSATPKRGLSFPDFKSLGLVLPIAGGAKGYNSSGDLDATGDGRDLNELWDEFQQTIALQNAERQRLVDLLTFSVSQNIESVAQFGGEAEFERASEYGVPQGTRVSGTTLSLGYTFDWYDLAARFTWQYLAGATAAQVEAVHNNVLAADNRLVFMEVMRTLFRNTNRTADINGQNHNVYTFWNADGTVPPAYKTNTFNGSHTHYRISGAAAITTGDLDEIEDDFASHGYGPENGTVSFVLVNRTEATVIRAFRFADGDRNDFIPAQGQPGLILPQSEQLVGGQVASTFRGMNVIGSYGNLLVIEEDYVPAGYVVGLVSGGQANIQNPIGLREHDNSALRGLRLVKGRDNDYPLIDSYYVRGFGTGVRQRGAGLIMQIKASGSYEIPAAYAAA